MTSVAGFQRSSGVGFPGNRSQPVKAEKHEGAISKNAENLSGMVDITV